MYQTTLRPSVQRHCFLVSLKEHDLASGIAVLRGGEINSFILDTLYTVVYDATCLIFEMMSKKKFFFL